MRVTLDDEGHVPAQCPGSPPPPPPPGGVSSAPQGNWVGTYGASGYALGGWTGSGDRVSLPSATVSLAAGSRYVWAGNTTDVRALQDPTATTRSAATWYDATRFACR